MRVLGVGQARVTWQSPAASKTAETRASFCKQFWPLAIHVSLLCISTNPGLGFHSRLRASLCLKLYPRQSSIPMVVPIFSGPQQIRPAGSIRQGREYTLFFIFIFILIFYCTALLLWGGERDGIVASERPNNGIN